MSGIYWLASYPKSGNTWLRALLTNYRVDSDAPASINELDGGWTTAVRETFDDAVGLESANLTREQIDFYRPAVVQWLARAATPSEPTFLKIHDAFASNGAPVVSTAATAGVIYAVRNPLDVAVSYAHHRNEPVDETIRVMSCANAMLAGSDRPGAILPQVVGSWSSHATGWIEASGLRVHVVRYEDLIGATGDVFAGIVDFAGLPVDARRIARAVERSRFERLRIQELEYGFDERAPTAASFFRAGRAGAWREVLTHAQVDRLVADHADAMQRFGYLSASGELQC